MTMTTTTTTTMIRREARGGSRWWVGVVGWVVGCGAYHVEPLHVALLLAGEGVVGQVLEHLGDEDELPLCRRVGRLLEEAVDLRGHEGRTHEAEEQEPADGLVRRLLVELLPHLVPPGQLWGGVVLCQ
jgi:hypothetical protein